MKALLVASALACVAACTPKGAAPSDVKDGANTVADAGAALSAAKGSYTCPMHPEVVADAPGKCPKCGMALVSTAPQAPIDVSVTTSPAQPKAGEKTKLLIEMKSNGARLSAFDVVHDKKLHLLMVTPDLAWFAHEHPEPLPDGTFALDFTFPSGGMFRLFSDFKATDRAGSVLISDVAVDGPPRAAFALVPTDLKAPRNVDGFAVRLTSPPPVAGVEKQLTFVITRDNKPVTDLEPYLGAMGHLVVIGSDAKTFLHAHPEDHAAPHDHPEGTGEHTHAPATTAPGLVSFSTTFPHPGLYKAWAQFQWKGKPFIADFVFDVPAGAPAATPAPHDHSH